MNLLNINPDKYDFPKTEAKEKKPGEKDLNTMVLERYADLLEVREKNKGKEGFVAKTDAELEKDARDKSAENHEQNL